MGCSNTLQPIFIAAATVVLLIARKKGYSLKIPGRERLPLVVAALSYMFVWHIASTYAAILLPSGQAALLGFTMPIWTMLLSWLALGERPSLRLFVAVALAALGVGVLAAGAWEAYASAPLGFLCGLSAAMGWAIGTLVIHRAQLTTPSIVATGWQLMIAGIPVSETALIHGRGEFFIPHWTTALVIGYITLIPMSLGNIAWFQIASNLPATVSGITTVMIPIVAMVTGAIFFDEPFGIVQMFAMASSACAVAIALSNRR